MRQGVWLVFAIAVITGCSSSPGGPARTPSRPSAVVSSSSLTAVTKRCGGPNVPARTFTMRTPDGVALAAVSTGTGRRGVVLVHELGPGGLCGWWDYAAYLSQRGFHVLLFDHRCTGESDCPSVGPGGNGLMIDINAAVDRLRSEGAARVALVGGSQGASEALIAASRASSGVTGVVALSADELTQPLAASPYPATANDAAPRLCVPVLFAVARGDTYVSVSETRRLVAATRSTDKHLTVLAADSGHGWDLVLADSAGTRPALSDTVVAFLRAATSVNGH